MLALWSVSGASAAPLPGSVTVCEAGPPACDFSSIAAALDGVASGGRVNVSAGSYAAGFTITRSVKIIGAGASATHIVGETVAVAKGASVTITGATVEGAQIGTQVVNDGSLTLRRSAVLSLLDGFYTREVGGIINNGSLVLQSSRVTATGVAVGAIRNLGSALVDDSHVDESTSFDAAVDNQGALRIVDSTVSDNVAVFSGGLHSSGRLAILRSEVNRNNGQGRSGINNSGSAVITNTELRDNAFGNSNDGDMTLHHVRIVIGPSGAEGGPTAGLANGGSARLIDSSIEGTGQAFEGTKVNAVRNSGQLTIAGTRITNAWTTLDGAGVWNSGVLTLWSSSLSGNRSFSNGGGIYNEGSLRVLLSAIRSNAADHSGGGIFNVGSAALIASSITGNSASDLLGSGLFGGGVANAAPGTLTTRFTNISGNTPDDCAGC